MVVWMLSGFSQHQFNFSVNAGIGKMKPIYYNSDPILTPLLEVENLPTYKLFAHYVYSLNRISFETGLDYNLMKGRHTELLDITDAVSGHVTTIKEITERTAHYINVPLIVNYSMEKFKVGFGASVGYLLTNSSEVTVFADNSVSMITGGGNNLDRYDYGLNGQLAYQISEKISIQIGAYYGMRDISNGTETGILYNLFQIDQFDRALKNRQLTAGLSYSLGK